MHMKKLLSIVTPCYNEALNIADVANIVKNVMSERPDINYEHIFIDNASTDDTVLILKRILTTDSHLRIIINSKNFGHIRSPYYGLLQANGDAVVLLVADLQDPPELILEFVKEWEKGNKIVIGIKNKSKENPLMYLVRKFYYYLVKKIADIEHISQFMGFGLYDKEIIHILRQIDDPYPYLRGIIAEIGFPKKEIKYTQNRRYKGKTKNNFYTLYDIAMLGFVNYSKIPLRIAVLIGFLTAFFSFLIAIFYIVYKLVYWNSFQLGLAPMVIGIFFFGAIQLMFIGILGEYIGAIYTQVRKRPLVYELERLNFPTSKTTAK